MKDEKERGGFKVGDRVAVYGGSTTGAIPNYGRLTGVVTGVIGDGRINVRIDAEEVPTEKARASLLECGNTFHQKQCRRLVKKERRRVWVEFDFLTSRPRAVADTYDQLNESWKKEGRGARYIREFVEVREECK